MDDTQKLASKAYKYSYSKITAWVSVWEEILTSHYQQTFSAQAHSQIPHHQQETE